MGKKRKYVSMSLDPDTATEVKATALKLQSFGFNNLPDGQRKHFTEGVTNSAIIDVALEYWTKKCLNDREPSAE